MMKIDFNYGHLQLVGDKIKCWADFCIAIGEKGLIGVRFEEEFY